VIGERRRPLAWPSLAYRSRRLLPARRPGGYPCPVPLDSIHVKVNAKSTSLLLGLLALIVAAAIFVLGPTDTPETGTGDLEPAARQIASEPGPAGRDVSDVTLARTTVNGSTGAPTSVLWPLVVDLELQERADLPTLAGIDPGATLGSGATARLAGRVGLGVDEAAVATIRFIAGPNKGRVLRTDDEGRFGATDLMPGLSMVKIEGPGLVGATREVRLRQRHEALLNIGFGRLGNVQGFVFAGEDEPIENAIVTIDGHSTRTDMEGFFYLPGLASGRTHIEIEKPGFASLREEVAVTASFTTPIDRLKYRLQPGSTLQVLVDGNVGGPGPAEIWLSPGVSNRLSNFPYWKLNPVRAIPGQLTTIRDLPSELIRVQVFRTGARAEPESRNVNLRGTQTQNLTVQLQSTPKVTGVVLREGLPVPGATVRLEAPNQVQAALRHYRQPVQFLESGYHALPPNARQVTTTDERGRFVLNQWTDDTPARYIAAEAPEGAEAALRLIGREDTEISLDLELLAEASGVLRIETSARFQGLPVEWRVNGAPREGFVVDPGEPLIFPGLREGVWRVRASWHADELADERKVEVTSDGAELQVELPQDAIVGQDREAWIRAGREYPF